MASEYKVEVVYALAERQVLIALSVAPGTTVAEVIERSGIADKFPDHDLSSCPLGIWGKIVDRDRVVEAGDRVEIYRQLEIDPRDARRKLAAQGKSMGRR